MKLYENLPVLLKFPRKAPLPVSLSFELQCVRRFVLSHHSRPSDGRLRMLYSGKYLLYLRYPGLSCLDVLPITTVIITLVLCDVFIPLLVALKILFLKDKT